MGQPGMCRFAFIISLIALHPVHLCRISLDVDSGRSPLDLGGTIGGVPLSSRDNLQLRGQIVLIFEDTTSWPEYLDEWSGLQPSIHRSTTLSLSPAKVSASYGHWPFQVG